MTAREWLERGRQSREPIDALSNFWRGLNNLFAAFQGDTERDKIRTFLAAKVSSDQAQSILNGYPAEVEYLLSQPVIDMRGNSRDTSHNIQAFRTAADAGERLRELFMVIYQVRCNLEHGQKSPSNHRDVKLCRCASPIVGDVVHRCA